ncbi:hypothetical protein AVEN_269576-1 [Araneus ventricosus]|uniref:Uncharacterized protein n=1 Tax=Araneus ventricosus TaxID=182803 RepID=A0A4Y2CDM2_ARAVE|nr:hypothetical protein AVEN_269576-1 [Araneus ventricosus]
MQESDRKGSIRNQNSGNSKKLYFFGAKELRAKVDAKRCKRNLKTCKLNKIHKIILNGLSGLVVRSQPLDRRVPGLKPNSTEEPPCKRVWYTLNPWGPNVLPLVWCGSLESGCQLKCCPFHLTVVQNYEIRPKIALVLLQTGCKCKCN